MEINLDVDAKRCDASLKGLVDVLMGYRINFHKRLVTQTVKIELRRSEPQF